MSEFRVIDKNTVEQYEVIDLSGLRNQIVELQRQLSELVQPTDAQLIEFAKTTHTYYQTKSYLNSEIARIQAELDSYGV